MLSKFVLTLPLRDSKHREDKWFAQDPTAAKWQNQILCLQNCSLVKLKLQLSPACFWFSCRKTMLIILNSNPCLGTPLSTLLGQFICSLFTHFSHPHSAEDLWRSGKVCYLSPPSKCQYSCNKIQVIMRKAEQNYLPKLAPNRKPSGRKFQRPRQNCLFLCLDRMKKRAPM